MNIRQVLKKFNLSAKETDIYMMAATLGIQPASVIAEKAGENRITTYVTLKRLTRKGMARSILKHGIQYFEVEPLHALAGLALRKQLEWKNIEKELQELTHRIPQETTPSTSLVRTYIGLEGVKNMLTELQLGTSFTIILSKDIQHTAYIQFYSRILFPCIVENNENTMELIAPPEKYAPLKHIKKIQYIPSPENFCHVDVFIVDKQKCAVVSNAGNTIQGIYIEGEHISTSLSQLFSLVHAQLHCTQSK